YSDWDCTLVDRGSQTFPCGSGHGRDAFCPAIDAPPAAHRGHGRSHREQGGGEQDGQPAIRLGLREVRGLSEEGANAIAAARRQAPCRNVADLCLRANLDGKTRRALAEAGALRSLAGHRNDARWQVAGIERQRPLLPGSPDEDPIALPAPGAGGDILTDDRATARYL